MLNVHDILASSSHKTQQIMNSLASCYDAVAPSYAHTRNKFWAEKDAIMMYINNNTHKHLIDLGTGSGRMVQAFYQKIRTHTDYTTNEASYSCRSVDLSSQLLDLARQSLIHQLDGEHPSTAYWAHQDMLSFLLSRPSESADIITAIASFQHINTLQQRKVIMDEIYRTLNNHGLCIMTNWSFSAWFIRKYLSQLIRGAAQSINPRSPLSWQDLMIPRKQGDKERFRYYHIFLLDELVTLAKKSGFSVLQACYLDQSGLPTNSRKLARNTFIVLQKVL